MDKNTIIGDLEAAMKAFEGNDEPSSSFADIDGKLRRLGWVVFNLARLTVFKETYEGCGSAEKE